MENWKCWVGKKEVNKSKVSYHEDGSDGEWNMLVKKVRDKNTLYTYTRAFVCHIV